jgi:valyl-tRNA synthetase
MELASHYDFAAAQQKWYPIWEERGYFHADPASDKPPFSIVIPPPNVTGALHLGHALNNTLQDILCRMRRMQGYEVLWMPGTDHAGIATQAVVERRLLAEEKLSRHDLGREGLVDRIWKWKEQYEARILGQLKQMGCSCDWERTRFTLDDQCARAVRETFFKLFSDGKIYRGKRLVNWDTYLQTAVSDDEVFHEETKGHFWQFHYPVIDPQPGEPTRVTIATTRPETMLGDTAVAVHPDPAKALDKVEADLRDKLAAAPAKEKPPIEKQLEAIAERRKTKLAQLETLRDMAKRGVKLKLPLTGREIPLVTDEWAKPELGSGCVKITPAHDANDYEVWQRHPEIGAISIMQPDGTLGDAVPEKYRGLTMPQARKAVIEDLTAGGFHDPETDVEDRLIDLAHSDRSKTPIEPYLADQWFVKMGETNKVREATADEAAKFNIPVGSLVSGIPDAGLAQSAIEAVESGSVAIAPARYAKSYLDWLSEKRDWPVGRQLWWGHRIPIWTLAFANEVERESLYEQSEPFFTGGDPESPERCYFWHEWDPQTKAGMAYFCLRNDYPDLIEQIEAIGYVHDEEVLDTWFSSALWPHSTMGWPEQTPLLKKFYPTSVLITSRDIITLWVARMVLMGEYNMGQVPFHQVYIHPKILDGFGETMSKSKGNGVDPLDVIEKFGADALRFGLAYITTETQDVRMPVEFECPHCGATIPQTKKNRVEPRVECKSCKQEFRTQWAEKEADLALPRGAVVSERFELARNFANKLWNASRFSLINLEGYQPGAIKREELLIEDRWLLSRLATVTRQVTESLDAFKYAEAAKVLYDFAWDDFCSFYVEMTKARFASPEAKPLAQRVLAFALDQLLRLLHPMMPFLTEEVWSLLGTIAPTRGLAKPQAAEESACIAAWPTVDESLVDREIESQFAEFQGVLGAVREIRSRQNIAMKQQLPFSVKCAEASAKRLSAMAPYFEKMANAVATELGPKTAPPAMAASVPLSGDLVGIEVYVDISQFIDVEAEQKRLTGEQEKLTKFAASIEGKLNNEKFVSGAPAEVVQQQRDKLAEVKEQLASIETALAGLGR